MQEVFLIRNATYNFRNQTYFKFANPCTSDYGLNSTRYLGPKIWNMLPDRIRLLPTLLKFKIEITKFTFKKLSMQNLFRLCHRSCVYVIIYIHLLYIFLYFYIYISFVVISDMTCSINTDVKKG